MNPPRVHPHCAHREDVHCAHTEDVHCADSRSHSHSRSHSLSLSLSHSHTPIHEGIHTGGRREAPPPCVEAARSAASFMDGCVAVCTMHIFPVCTVHIFPGCTMHIFPVCTMHIFSLHKTYLLPAEHTVWDPRILGIPEFKGDFFDFFRTFSGMSQECSQDVWTSSKGLPATF